MYPECVLDLPHSLAALPASWFRALLAPAGHIVARALCPQPTDDRARSVHRQGAAMVRRAGRHGTRGGRATRGPVRNIGTRGRGRGGRASPWWQLVPFIAHSMAKLNCTTHCCRDYRALDLPHLCGGGGFDAPWMHPADECLCQPLHSATSVPDLGLSKSRSFSQLACAARQMYI